MDNFDLKLFAGNSNRKLAEDIASELNLSLSDCTAGKFSDGEVNLKINESIRGKDVFFIQSICAPQNDSLMELLVFLDAAKRASAGRITAVVPYYGYGRQDHKIGARDPISAKLVADLISTAGAQRMLSIDLHSAPIQGFFNIPVDNLDSAYIVADFIHKHKKELLKDLVIVSPDTGGVRRARAFSRLLSGAGIAIVDKMRPKENVAEVFNVIGDVKGKTCIMFDDMVDTAGSLTLGSQALKDNDAKKIFAYCTHGILSGKAIENINSSPIEKLFVSDSIPLNGKESSKIEQITISSLLAKAIKCIHENLSVSELFETERSRQEKIV